MTVRRPLLLLVAVLAVFGLAACDADGTPSTSTTSEKREMTTTSAQRETTTTERLIEVPDLVGMTLDRVYDAVGDLDVETRDASGKDRRIVRRSNWTVTRQEPTAGTRVVAGSSIEVTVENERDREEEVAETTTTAAPATTTATSPPPPPPTEAPAPPPAPRAPAPPASVSYKTCSEARAAGAAPVYAGDPGYGRHLDSDGDGVGCE